MTPRTTVLIVEPSDLIIEGLRAIISEADDFSLLAPLHDAQPLLQRSDLQYPDLLLINPTTLTQPPSAQIDVLRRSAPSMAIIAIATQLCPPTMLAPFGATIDLYDNRSRIIATLREASSSQPEGEENPNYELSDREVDVLVLLAQGLSSKEIASRLHISVHTVNTHRKNITHKTNIKSIAGLAVYATLHNLI